MLLKTFFVNFEAQKAVNLP